MLFALQELGRRLYGISAVFIVVSFVCDPTFGEESWPTWRGAHRDGISAETDLNFAWDKRPPKLQWIVQGTGEGYSSLAIAHGKIFTLGQFDNGQAVVALDQKNGKPIWKTVISTEGSDHGGYRGPRSTPTVDGDRVYVISSQGSIACLDVKDGKKIWEKNFRDWGQRMMSGWGFTESPLVDGDLVLCTPGGAKAMIVALNKKSGAEVWKCSVPDFARRGKEGAAYSSIVISHGGGVKQYVQLIGHGVIGVRAKDGKFLWGYDGVANDVANIPTPICDGDFVFCSTGYGAGSALLELSASGDGVKFQERYFLDGNKLQNHHGGFVLHDGYVYGGAGHNEGFPFCVDLKTGKLAWGGKARGAGSGSAAAAFADGHLILRYQSGEVAAIEANPKSFKLSGVLRPEYQERESWSHPVILDKKLYLREQNKLMCYDLSK